MRTWTTAEERAYDSNSPETLVRVEVEDSSGTLQDWSALNGYDHIQSVSWGESLEQPFSAGSARITWRRTPDDNFSPFISGQRYEGYLDVWRQIVISTKVVPPGADASGFSWQEVFRGRIDDFDLSRHPGEIHFRDKIGAELMDGWIYTTTTKGGGGKDVETVIGDILTGFDKESNTLRTPVATGVGVRSYNQQPMPIMDAITRLAVGTIGWDVRPLWSSADSAFRLTLYEPGRSAVTPDFTFPKGHVLGFSRVQRRIQDVRNAVRVFYGNAGTTDEWGNDLRSSVTRTSETSPAHDMTGSAVANSSIARYGWKFMQLGEASTSLIQTVTDATNLADFAITDLKDPVLHMGVQLAYYFWPVEVNDLIRISPDDIRFDANQTLGVHGWQHEISADGARTTLTLRGQPGLSADSWLRREARPGQAMSPDDAGPSSPAATATAAQLGARLSVSRPNYALDDADLLLIYRSTTAGVRGDLLASVREMTEFRDGSLDPDTTYYYQTRFQDRQGNLGSLSAQASVTPERLPFGHLTDIGSFSVRQSTAQTLTDGDTLSFDTYDHGEDLGWFSTSTNRFTAPTGGVYQVHGLLSMAELNASQYYISVKLNDDLGAGIEEYRVGVREDKAGDSSVTIDELIALDEGDTVELVVQFVTETATSETIPEHTEFEVMRTLSKRTRPIDAYQVLTQEFNTSATSHAVTMPTSVNAGDLLLIVFGQDGTSIPTVPSGWTNISGASTTAPSSAARLSVFAKDAAGTEGGTTVDVVTASACVASAHVYHVRAGSWNGTVSDDVDGGGTAASTGTSADPGTIDPSWSDEESLYIACAVYDDGTATTVGNETYPTDYTDGTRTTSEDAGAGVAVTLLTARRTRSVTTENPGAFTMPSSSEENTSAVVAVRSKQ